MFADVFVAMVCLIRVILVFLWVVFFFKASEFSSLKIDSRVIYANHQNKLCKFSFVNRRGRGDDEL